MEKLEVEQRVKGLLKTLAQMAKTVQNMSLVNEIKTAVNTYLRDRQKLVDAVRRNQAACEANPSLKADPSMYMPSWPEHKVLQADVDQLRRLQDRVALFRAASIGAS